MKVKDKKLIAYFSTIRLSEKGQVVLPKEYRSEQHLEAGSDMAALKIGSGLLLLPQMDRFNTLCNSIERVLMKNNLTISILVPILNNLRLLLLILFLQSEVLDHLFAKS